MPACAAGLPGDGAAAQGMHAAATRPPAKRYIAPGQARPVSRGEIAVPRGVREFMPAWAEPTVLGDPRGASRQYRYGNLHIREYADRYTVHVDRADPRSDPVGHLIHDAPEVLAGIVGGAAAGAAAYLWGRSSGAGRRSCARRAAAAALSAGYVAYEGSKWLRERGSPGRPPGRR